MSNIYIQEPPSIGKVLLKTTVGDIDIELWSKETPKACRNFVQLCLEGYYNNTIFHRIVKGFIAQGGDPTGTGTGGDSIYGAPFKDEFHSRLRFVRRGLVAMANAGKDDNGSQFFFTLGATPELQNKHTIFGKVTGETIFNMIKLEDALVDHDDRPKYPQKILKTEVLSNPFPDIVPRTTPVNEDIQEKKEKKKDKGQAVKNFKLLSFGEEAEEDEELTIQANQKYSGRSKSTHDVLEDPTLSSVPAVEKDESTDSEDLSEDEDTARHGKSSNAGKDKEKLDAIRNKLKKNERDKNTSSLKRKSISEDQSSYQKEVEEDGDEEEYVFGQAAREEKRHKKESISKEIEELKKSYQQSKKHKQNHEKSKKDSSEEQSSKSSKQDVDSNLSNLLLKEHKESKKKFKEMKSQMPKKGSSRENFTLDLLEKFKKKLHGVRERETSESTSTKIDDNDDDDDNSDAWLAHKLKCETATPVLAKDANTKDNDWYEISDPRSKISQKRREISKALMKKRER